MAKSSKKPVEMIDIEREAKKLSELFKNVKSRASFAKKLGLNPTMINQHLKMIRPISLDYAKKYAEGFGCGLADISERLFKEIQQANKFIEIENDDEYSYVDSIDLKLSAGTGNIVTTHDIHKQLAFRTEFLRSLGVNPNHAKGFPVDGDSMVDAHIPHGSIVLVNIKKREPINKKFFAIWIDDRYYIKQLIKNGDKWIARSHNEEKSNRYPDKVIDTEDSGIVGQAVWCAFRL